ncbi:hypothetical protein K9U40_13795 [Xanthobacter autotrophicus]|uniref:hypothetical protein n=1 Tax=Xanthobacter TaxID=279 RepID=UPI0024AB8879|nr:hypothetical protein [Xanthobacter autotrophicus]MDI4665393.1 hypothetical protein [Xanthobacter autotrophicus]
MPDHRNMSRQGYDPKRAMAFALAVVATFFGAPELYHLTIGFVMAFAERHYGPEMLGAVLIGWAAIIAALTFFSAQISFDMAIVSTLLAVAMRFF